MRRVFLAGLIAAAGSPVIASSPIAPSTSIEVRYHDLDLSTGSGQKALRRRIANAAEAICGEVDTRDIGLRMKIQGCRTKTLASAEIKYQEVVAAATSGNIRIAAVE